MAATRRSSQPSRTGPPLDDERASQIRVAVREAGTAARRRHRFLRHQSAIGVGVLVAATAAVLTCAWAYATGALAWWAVVPISAFAMSLAHEIEHDTIHRLYFPRNRRAQGVMLGVCWLLRPYTISPWSRKPLHLLHHKVSGSDEDYEERGISNGERWGLRRAIMMVDPAASALLRRPRERDHRSVYVDYVLKAFFPLTYLALAIWYSWVVLSITALLLPLGGPFDTLLDRLGFAMVVWIGPNILRVVCLHLISSNMHYFGDIEPGNVVQQTQVLNRWFLAPAQLFCFNFGSTHSIHHFVPGDPFYLRQLTARQAHAAMAANGVRFNDLGTFGRANRYLSTDHGVRG